MLANRFGSSGSQRSLNATASQPREKCLFGVSSFSPLCSDELPRDDRTPPPPTAEFPSVTQREATMLVEEELDTKISSRTTFGENDTFNPGAFAISNLPSAGAVAPIKRSQGSLEWSEESWLLTASERKTQGQRNRDCERSRWPRGGFFACCRSPYHDKGGCLRHAQQIRRENKTRSVRNELAALCLRGPP